MTSSGGQVTREDHIVRGGVQLVEPGFEHIGEGLAKRDGALLAALAEDFDVSAGAERHVLTPKARRLRQAEARLQGRQQQRMIPAAGPSGLVRRREKRIDLGARQEVDQLTDSHSIQSIKCRD